jgi:hypothetical protein
MVGRRIGIVAGLMTVALLRPLAAQQGPLTLGQWVRVVSATDSIVHEGHLILVVADTVVLARGQSQEYAAVGGNSSLEVGRRTRSHVLKGALLGTGIGMALGALTWAWRGILSCPYFDACTSSLGQTGRVVVGGLLGLGAGALIGAHVYTMVWDPVPEDQLGRLRTSMVPRLGSRMGLGASLAF